MRILIIGASQGTGALAVRNALDRGHAVTAFSRSPQKLGFAHSSLTLMPGSFHDDKSVKAAVSGHDAVIVTASVTRLSEFKKSPNYFSEGTGLVIEAMRASGVKRLVVLSALGVGESRSLRPPIVRFVLMGWILKLPFADHERQEAMVRDSGLDYVIARPGRLTNRPARGGYQKTTRIENVRSGMPRADVADFLVAACEGGEFVGKAVQIGP